MCWWGNFAILCPILHFNSNLKAYIFEVDIRKEQTVSKVALITGASRGLGQVMANFLAGKSYDLVLTARQEAPLNHTAMQISEYGVQVIALPGDVADPDHREHLIQAAADLGGLHLLVNNASILGPTPMPPLEKYPLKDLEDVFRVNLLAPLGLIQVGKHLLVESAGLVINISSDAAVGGYPGWGGYGTSKAALDLLSLTLANELSDVGIAVVSVDPGDMRTQMHQDAYSGEDISDRPLPEATLPFWAWLLGQDHDQVNGRRFQAQTETWVVPV